MYIVCFGISDENILLNYLYTVYTVNNITIY
jgi:hypothetical protein